MDENIPDMPPAQYDHTNNPFKLHSELSKEDLEATLGDLRAFNAENRVGVAESVFREFFLPAFTDGAQLDKNVRAWAGLVNGFNRWANVLDDRTMQILFEVPPIFDTNTFNAAAPADPNQPTIGNVIEMAIHNTNNRLMQRPTVLRDSTLSYLAKRVNSKLRPDYVEAWRKIYAYYGIPFEITAEVGESAEAVALPEAAQAQERDLF